MRTNIFLQEKCAPRNAAVDFAGEVGFTLYGN